MGETVGELEIVSPLRRVAEGETPPSSGMQKKASRKENPGRPHSEKAGEVALESGGRITLYRALRDLTCSRCAAVIRKGESFTREADQVSGLPLVRRCRNCVPFTTGGGLLDALFVAEGGGDASSNAAPAEVREKVLSRLRPALASCRKRRSGPASKG